MDGMQIPDFAWEAAGKEGEGVEMAFLEIPGWPVLVPAVARDAGADA